MLSHSPDLMFKLPIQMYDPTRYYFKHQAKFDAKIKEIIHKGSFINGPEVGQLEKKLQDYTGAIHAVTCANGTDALFIALRALDIGSGDEVITVGHTWISTSETIALAGAKPVFVDIREEDFNIDPNKIEEKITEKTKAILFVSLYGLMPDCQNLHEIATKHQLKLIEDGAQSFGAEYLGSKSCSCKYTDIATTSFFPSKPLGCWGDGGAIMTNDENLARKIRSIKNHGGLERFHHKYIGLNSRLDTLQAAVLLVKMETFDDDLEERNKHAEYYTEKLEHISLLKKPFVDKSSHKHVWAQYSLLCPSKEVRDSLSQHLKNNQINVSIFYPVGLHKQECFSYLGETSLEVTDKVCDTILNLPSYAEITYDEQDYIIQTLISWFNPPEPVLIKE